jgi:cytochrome c oxidase assembly protein subunit 15
MTPSRYRTIAVATLVALSVIIVTGAAVRLTNSGLGCDDWPNCSKERLIDVSSKHAAIEQINRLFTGVVGAAAIAAVLGSLVRRPRRRDLVVLSVLISLGVVANAVLGGISVLVDLHPLAVQGHMLLSMALIITGSVLVRRAGEPDGEPRIPVVSLITRRLTWALFGLTTLAVVAGTHVTGAGPHAGDETAERLDVAIPTVARIHGVIVMMAVATGVALGIRVWSRAGDRRQIGEALATWLFLGVLQAALGYVQYFNGVPALLVGIHVAGATAVMIAATFVVLDTTRPLATAEIDGASGRPADDVVIAVDRRTVNALGRHG